jgi:hypothetical protein
LLGSIRARKETERQELTYEEIEEMEFIGRGQGFGRTLSM